MLKKFLIFLICAVLCGCIEEQPFQETVDFSCVEVSIDLRLSEDGFTKSVNDPETIVTAADVIKNLWVIQFNGITDDATVLGEPLYISEIGTLEDGVTLNVKASLVETDESCAIYFIANTFEEIGFFPVNKWTTIGDLKARKRLVSDHLDLLGHESPDKQHVMFNGCLELDRLKSSASGVSLPVEAVLHRNIAKATINVRNSAPADDNLVIRSLQVCSVPSISFYLTEVGLQSPYPSTNQFTKVNYDEIVWQAGMDEMSFDVYLPINMRGISDSGSSMEKNRYAPDGATYLLISAIYTEGGIEYPITYTFYLGENMVNDYNIEAGRHYKYSFDIKGLGDADNDNRVSNWGLVDFAEKGQVANSYILNPIPSGTFKRHFRIPMDQIKLFWGNQGYENDSYYSLSNNPTWRCFVLASDFEINDSNFEIVTKNGNINTNKYFEVAVAPGVKGNVIVGVGSATDNTVSWSWHLWITDYVPDECFAYGNGEPGRYIYPVTGGSVHRYADNSKTYWKDNGQRYIMDRNLGSFSAETYPSDNIGLLYYQYGRKDPFFYSDAVYQYPTGSSINFKVKGYNDEDVKVNHLRYSVRNPLHFISGAKPESENSDSDYTETWIMDEKYVKSTLVWNDPLTESGKSRSGKKSIFDPCPPGYRLPDSGIWEGFTSQGNGSGNPKVNATTNAYHNDKYVIDETTAYSRGFKPFNLVKGLHYWPYDKNKDDNTVPTQLIYNPASGYKHQTQGDTRNDGNHTSEYWSFLWSEDPSSSKTGQAIAHASQPNNLSTSTGHRRSRGLPVRCITDN